MKARVVSLFLTGLWLAVASSASALALQQAKAQSQKKSPPLVRKDLLASRKKNLKPPLRNIFTRARGSLLKKETLGFNPAANASSPSEEPSLDEPTAPLPLNIRYIGYVESGERVIALVLFEGNAVAVETGDILGTGLTVGTIAPDEIEIVRPDASVEKVRLEGEKP
ncbi:MAG: hypothetical protein ACE5LV_04505 [Candidatus Aminicenantales bacterium]